MADANQSSAELLALIPHPSLSGRSKGPNGLSRQHTQTMRNAVLRSARALTRALAAIAAIDDGTSGSTTALYRVDTPALDVLVDGVHLRRAAVADDIILGAGQTIISYDAAGAAMVALPDNDTDAKFALCAILVNGAVVLRAVFGAIAGTGAAVASSPAQIGTALQAAGITNADLTVGLIVARGTVARGTDAIVITGVDPASDDALKAEQSIGSLFNLSA